MTMTTERRGALLAYCRIDDPSPEDEVLLELLYDAAVGYLEQAGVSQPAEGTTRAAQYDLCVNYMVLDGYDRRDRTVTGSGVNGNPAFRMLLNQLKLTEPEVSNSDTSGEEDAYGQ